MLIDLGKQSVVSTSTLFRLSLSGYWGSWSPSATNKNLGINFGHIIPNCEEWVSGKISISFVYYSNITKTYLAIDSLFEQFKEFKVFHTTVLASVFSPRCWCIWTCVKLLLYISWATNCNRLLSREKTTGHSLKINFMWRMQYCKRIIKGDRIHLWTLCSLVLSQNTKFEWKNFMKYKEWSARKSKTLSIK